MQLVRSTRLRRSPSRPEPAIRPGSGQQLLLSSLAGVPLMLLFPLSGRLFVSLFALLLGAGVSLFAFPLVPLG